MIRIQMSLACLAGALILVGCDREQPDQAETVDAVAIEAGTAGTLMRLPVTTASEEARQHFLEGQRAMDMGRTREARQHFTLAIDLDPAFAYAHLNRALLGNSLEDFLSGLEEAAAHEQHASEAERLLIRIAEQFRENDLDEQLQLSERLTEVAPESPRAWLQLAGVQSSLNRENEARRSIRRAIELAPSFAPAHMQLGNSYLFVEPRDLAMAEESMKRAVELAPDEAAPHDLLGDTYRMQGDLEQAAAEYTRAAELEPDNGLPLQQRGHVHSFLGNYDQARADYDASIELSEPNQKANYGVYRAFVSVHAGEPEAAIRELGELVEWIDGMDVPNARGNKIFALTSQAQIALHHGMYDVAERALSQRAELTRESAREVGTEEARLDEEAEILLWEGTLAARRGEYEEALGKAAEAMRLLEPIRNPTKDQPVHELMGLVSLLKGDHQEAVGHYEQANPNDIYATYHQALALEGAGREAEARALFEKVANWRFNALGLALVREEAIQKAS